MTREELKQYKYNQTHKIINGILHKKCSKCPEDVAWKPMNEQYFYKWNRSPDGFMSQCSYCQNEAAKKRQKDNWETVRIGQLEWFYNNHDHVLNRFKNRRKNAREYDRAYTAQYIKEHPEQAKNYGYNRFHKNHDISNIEFHNCCLVFNYRCAYCGKTLEEQLKNDKEWLHQEHVFNNGYNDLRNCVPACKSCNSQKSTKDIDEWYNKDNPIFNEEKYKFIIEWCTEGYKQYIEKKPPYRIVKQQNEGLSTYHFELWSVDEKRYLNICMAIKDKKKQLEPIIKYFFNSFNINISKFIS